MLILPYHDFITISDGLIACKIPDIPQSNRTLNPGQALINANAWHGRTPTQRVYSGRLAKSKVGVYFGGHHRYKERELLNDRGLLIFSLWLFPASNPTLPRRHIHPESTYVQHWRKMLQIVTFGVFDAQAGDAVAQIARGFESVDGDFKKIGSAGFRVDVQRRADAEIALERVVLSHRPKLR